MFFRLSLFTTGSQPSTVRRWLAGPQEGFALLEALVAMLVFALGILGMVGLQAA